MNDRQKAFWVVVCFLFGCFIIGPIVTATRRVTAIERIVGTEVPASMTWTNGHTYTSIVKHSANCPCVKK